MELEIARTIITYRQNPADLLEMYPDTFESLVSKKPLGNIQFSQSLYSSLHYLMSQFLCGVEEPINDSDSRFDYYNIVYSGSLIFNDSKFHHMIYLTLLLAFFEAFSSDTFAQMALENCLTNYFSIACGPDMFGDSKHF